MNQRIRELFTPKLNEWGAENDDNFTEELEKFAELIVRECIGVCNKIYSDNYPEAYDFERSEEGEAIKEHFGLK